MPSLPLGITGKKKRSFMFMWHTGCLTKGKITVIARCIEKAKGSIRLFLNEKLIKWQSCYRQPHRFGKEDGKREHERRFKVASMLP